MERNSCREKGDVMTDPMDKAKRDAEAQAADDRLTNLIESLAVAPLFPLIAAVSFAVVAAAFGRRSISC